MQRGLGATLTATVPAALTYPGLLRYWVVVKLSNGTSVTFPGSQEGSPRDWDYFDTPGERWDVPLVASTAALSLFRADADRSQVEAQGLGQQAWLDYPTTADGALALRLVVAPPRAGQPAPEAGPAASLRAYLGPKLAGRATDLTNPKELVIKGQTNQVAATQLRVLLVTKDAVAYAATVPLAATLGEARVPLSSLQPTPMLLTPRPYPGFLPLTFKPAATPPFRLADVEVMQLLLDRPASLSEPLHVDIESVILR